MIVELADSQRQDMLDAATRRSAELGHEIANIEAQFEAEYGDGWTRF